MPDKMYLVITIRKEVATSEEGTSLFQNVKDRFADKPELAISGHITNHFSLETE